MNGSGRTQPKTPCRPERQPTGAELPVMKPRKVNSEARKQQNRLASRNYREKRKRKLQQLEKLLEDDEPSQSQSPARLTSPYDGCSSSGSIEYERSIASSSPHITAFPGNLEPRQPEHTSIANHTWSTPLVASIEQPLAYTYTRPAMNQQSTIYNVDTPVTASYLVPSTMPSSVSTAHIALDPARRFIHSSQASSWPYSRDENFHFGSMHPQVYVPSTATYTTTWQHSASEDLATGIAIDPYGRRYYTYEPS